MKIQTATYKIMTLLLIVVAAVSCARMGAPDGGWYDETPPHVVSASPSDRGTNANSNKVVINFDEFIKIDNPTEKVVISPPQTEQPEIKAAGKRILINLLDSLKPNTTYTIDFSDAISDNNEGNPMGNYTYSFSTGEQIDTLEVSGTVLNAEDLEPVKGILVGLYPAVPTGLSADSAAAPSPMLRVSRTDSRGHFVIRGIAPGEYTVGALQDIDGDYTFSSRGEKMAFSTQIIKPSCYPDHRQDTIWADDIHIKDIERVPYTHFTPDNIVLRAFDHAPTARYYTKFDRTNPDHFTLFFTAPLTEDSIRAYEARANTPSQKRTAMRHQFSILPELKLLPNSDAAPVDDFGDVIAPVPGASASGSALVPGASPSVNDWAIVEVNDDESSLSSVPSYSSSSSGRGSSANSAPLPPGSTITYWLRDTTLINQDTLRIELTTLATDTLGQLQPYVDTLTILPKVSYEKRLKVQQRQQEEWQKNVEKKKKKLKDGEELTAADTIMPVKRLQVKYEYNQHMSPDGTVRIVFPTPMQRVDTTAIHLYVEQDSLWFRAPIVFEAADNPYGGANVLMSPDEKAGALNTSSSRAMELSTDWIPGAQYSLEIDSLAFEDIYGITSEAFKAGIVVNTIDTYSSLFVNVTGVPVPDASSATVPDASSSAPVPGASASGKIQIIVQLLDRSDKEKYSATVEDGTAEFYYIEPGSYYMRAIIDRNGNGRWDTGDYYTGQQPEEVYYNPEQVECKAKWDVTRNWNLTDRPLNQQKPSELLRQKADKEKTIKHRNAQRAKDKGIPLPAQYQ